MRQEQVTLVVNDETLGVSNSDNVFIASQVVPVAPNAAITQEAGAYHLVFPIEIAPLSFSTFFVTAKASSPSTARHSHRKTSAAPQPIEGLAFVSQVEEPTINTFIENDLLRVDFNDKTGLIVNYTDKTTSVTLPFSNDMAWYDSYQTGDGQLDGAYVFRPNTQTPHSLSTAVTLKILKGPLVSEIWQTFTPWLSQIVRLRHGSPVVEFEWTVGPIPYDDMQGKNIISRFNTSIASNGTFYTDSSARHTYPHSPSTTSHAFTAASSLTSILLSHVSNLLGMVASGSSASATTAPPGRGRPTSRSPPTTTPSTPAPGSPTARPPSSSTTTAVRPAAPSRTAASS